MFNTTSKLRGRGRLIRELLLASTLALFNFMVVAAENYPAEILGNWEMTVNTRMGASNVTLDITAGDGSIHIVWDSSIARGGSKVADEVRWEEGELKFNIPITLMMNGDKIQSKVNYVISFDGGELSGREITPMGMANFTGQRVESL